MTPSGRSGNRTASSAATPTPQVPKDPTARGQSARHRCLLFRRAQVQGLRRRGIARLARAVAAAGRDCQNRAAQRAIAGQIVRAKPFAMHPRRAPLQRRRAALARLQGQRTCAALPQGQQAHAILSLELPPFQRAMEVSRSMGASITESSLLAAAASSEAAAFGVEIPSLKIPASLHAAQRWQKPAAKQRRGNLRRQRISVLSAADSFVAARRP